MFEQRQKGEPSCLMFANPLMSLTSITSLWFVVKLDLHCHFSIFFRFWSSYLQRKAHYLYQTSPLQFWKWILHPPYRLPITFLILPGFHGASRSHACLFSLLSNHPFRRLPRKCSHLQACVGVASSFFSCWFFDPGVLIAWLRSLFICEHVCYSYKVANHSVIGTCAINNNQPKEIICLRVIMRGGPAAVTGLIHRKHMWLY